MTAWLPRPAAPLLPASLFATALLAAVLLGAAPRTGSAQSIDCDGEYIVKRGDTLARISRSAYGTMDYYRALYRLNRAVIGPDPSGIEVGIVLRIPCLDSSGQVIEAAPEPAPEAETVAAEPTPAPTGPTPDRAMRIAVAAGWPPLTGGAGQQGGMLTEIVARAARALDLPRGVEIYYLDDWTGLIDPGLAGDDYDIALAWPRPDCARAAPGSEAAGLCTRLVWSEPLYEQVIGVYTLTSAPPPLSASDLYGATICRPAGYPVYPLAEQKLTEPDVTLAQPDTARDCFQGVLDGAYQAVVMAQDVADGTIAALGAGDTVIRQPTLDRITTLHAVALRENPLAVERLSALDAEIRSLKMSGAWFEIVRRHMAAFRMQ